MNEQMLPVFFWLMVFSLGGWFYLMHRLLHLLKERHPELYQSLGCPNLIVTRSRKTARSSVLGMLANRTFRQLNDPDLDRLCEGMRAIGLLFLATACGSLLLVL